MALTNLGTETTYWTVSDPVDGPGEIGGSAVGSKDTGALSYYQKPTASTNIGTTYTAVRGTSSSSYLFVASNPA